MLGPYRIVQRIASGGMGTVYRAEHTTLNREVALKVLLPSLSEDERLVARFRREARSASALCHPNIIEIKDLGVDSGEHYMAMEYVPGGSLQDLLRKRGALDEKQALTFARQIANALQYAHERGLVHRDVKPSNVLLRDDGTCVLADFGIVLATNGTKLTQTVSAIGTPDYMSPEQVLGRKLDGRSDVYALGIMLYEMLTGEPPFRGRSEASITIINKHLNVRLPNIQKARKGISSSTRRILDRACAKKPGDRFASAGAMARALDHALGEKNMTFFQRIGVQFGLLRPASDSATRRVALTLGGIVLRLASTILTLAIVLILVVGGLATFVASIGIERFIGNSVWNLRAGMVGDRTVTLDDIRVPLRSMMSTYSLGIAQSRELEFLPPDQVRASLDLDANNLVVLFRLREVNGAPNIELLNINGIGVPVIGPALARGVNRGMLRAWRNESVVLRQLDMDERQVRMRSDAVSGALPAIVEGDSDVVMLAGIDTALFGTVGVSAIGLVILWLMGRWLAARRRSALAHKAAEAEMEKLEVDDAKPISEERLLTQRSSPPELPSLTQTYRPGVALLEFPAGNANGQKVPVGIAGREAVWIGSDCDPGENCVQLTGPGISRKHALVEWHEGKLWLMDAGSEAGTRLNGVKVTSKVPLKAGDSVAFADIVAHVRGRE